MKNAKKLNKVKKYKESHYNYSSKLQVYLDAIIIGSTI